VKPVFVIARREVASFFLSPIAYAVMTAWLLWHGVTYYLLAQAYAQQAATGGTDNVLTAFFGGTIFFYFPPLVFVPVITMRLIAEERRSGTLETLLTAPVTAWHVIAGKYLAAMAFWVLLWVPTLLHVWITSRFGHVDPGAITATYLGVFSFGAYYLAIGLLMSAVASNQIVAAVLSFMTLGLLFAIGIGQFIFEGNAQKILEYVSVWNHMSVAAKGIVDTRMLVFDGTVVALALFFATQVLDSRRAP
jgi:ABC-2 type transport system permease protein